MEYDIDQRKNKILELINHKNKVKVSELSKMFGISEVTIRNDLQDLEEKGLLTRIHGGAVNTYRTYFNMNYSQRAMTNKEEKQSIAEKLCEHINDNDTIMMNSGTSIMYAFKALMKFRNINIVTNSIMLALESITLKNINVILLGGYVNAEHQFTYGIDAEKQLSNYHADKAILSIDGISSSTGLSTYYKEAAELCRQMTLSADKVIVLADYTKIGRTAFTKITNVQAADYLITNNKPLEEIEKIKKKGVTVYYS